MSTASICAVTTNQKRAKDPGNVLLDAGEANLLKPSIVIVSKVTTVHVAALGGWIGSLSPDRMHQILAGMRFVKSLVARA